MAATEDPLDEIGKMLAELQGRALAQHFVMRAILLTLARDAEEPRARLEEMFAEATALSDRLAEQAAPAGAELVAIDAVQRMFEAVLRDL